MRDVQPPRLQTINGVYYIFWRDQIARRERRRTLNTRDPVQAAAAFMEHVGGQDGQSGTACASVSDVIDYYLEQHIAVKAADPATARKRLEIVRRDMGAASTKSISVDVCRSYLAKREAAGVKPGTVRGELAYLQAAARYALKRGIIQRDQLPVIDLPPGHLPRQRWLSFEEWERLLNASWMIHNGTHWRQPNPPDECPTRAYLFCMLAYYTAGRKSAVEQLTWDQVDLEHDLIYLNPAGRRQTRKRRATVPMHPKLRPALEWARAHREGPYVMQHAGDCRRAFNNAVARAQLPDDVTPHVLRHTRATHLAIRGVQMQDIADLLGDTLEVVERTYRHLSPHHLKAKLENV